MECTIYAAQIGLNTPNTYITKRKARLLQIREQGNLITKNITDILVSHTRNFMLRQQTFLVTDKYLNYSSEYFVPSLFQNAIQKVADIRAFIMFDRIYTTAIFSPVDLNDPDSSSSIIDFRIIKNFMKPFVLPKDIEEKLDKFMKAIDMNCGSIDMIYTPKGEYVFLEVNPVGQYQWLEKSCPSIKNIYGNILSDKLASVLENSIFQSFSMVKKDEIEVCKDCEFRYVCSDCRAHIDNIYDKPKYCNYNPYTATYDK